MNYKDLVLNAALIGVSFLGTQSLYATNNSDIKCPTIDELKQFKLYTTEEVQYHPETQLLDYYVSYEQEVSNDDVDQGFPNEESYRSNLQSFWTLRIVPVPAERDTDVVNITNDIITKLEPVSAEPFNYIQWSWKKNKMPVCVYRLPGNNSISAVATYEDPDFSSPVKQHAIENARRHIIKSK